MRPLLSLLLVALAACATNTPDSSMPPTGSDDSGYPTARRDAGPYDPPDPVTDAASSPLTDGGASSGDTGTPPMPGAAPLDVIDQASLYIVVGDSIAAGYDASGRNGEGGRAFARLLVDNHGAYPAFAERRFRARWPTIDFRRVADSGATSDEILANLRSALGGSLPASVPGDVIVSINAGGNDFNDSIATILDPTRTAAVAARVKGNILEMIRLLRDRYEDPAAGKELLVMVHNLHDPTDGTGRIPAGFSDGFCSTLRSPLLTDGLRSMAIANLETMNGEIAAAAGDGNAVLVDVHSGFLGHGMNGGDARWLSGDCTHPTDEGHHHLRRIAWETISP